jgi:hypothetical protein
MMPLSLIYTVTLVITSFVVGACSGGIVPELYVGIASPIDGGLATATLEPSLKWSTKGNILNGFCDYTGGVNVRSDENGQLPFNVWGSLQKSLFGWNCKTRFDTESSDLNELDFDIQVVGGPSILSLRASGYVNNYRSKSITGQIENVALTQGFRLPFIGGKLSVSPAYNLISKRTKVGLIYDITSNAQITFDANKDQQKVSIAYNINDSNSIKPSLTSNGDISVDYQYAVRDGGIVTTKYRPNDSTTVEYKDGPWIASATLPIDGYYKLYTKPKFSIRRYLTVE